MQIESTKRRGLLPRLSYSYNLYTPSLLGWCIGATLGLVAVLAARGLVITTAGVHMVRLVRAPLTRHEAAVALRQTGPLADVPIVGSLELSEECHSLDLPGWGECEHEGRCDTIICSYAVPKGTCSSGLVGYTFSEEQTAIRRLPVFANTVDWGATHDCAVIEKLQNEIEAYRKSHSGHAVPPPRQPSAPSRQ